MDDTVPEDESRLAALTAAVLAAASPADAMQAALEDLLERQQHPALAARLFESVVWRADLRRYWIYFRMARAYTALGPERDDAAFMMAAQAVQLEPNADGSNQPFGDLFAIFARRGQARAAVEVFWAGAAAKPEHPPARPEAAAPVFAAAGVALPGQGRAASRFAGRRDHRVIDGVERPAWTCPTFGGGLPFALRPLASPMGRLSIDVAEFTDAEVLISDDATVVLDRGGAVHPDVSVSQLPELVRAKLDRLSASAAPPPVIEVAEVVLIADEFPAPNLCHFLLDQITRLALYQALGVIVGDAAVIGPQPEAAFQRRILQRAGVERMIGTRQTARVRAGRLWVASNCRRLQHAADFGAAWAVDYARTLLGGQGDRGWRRLYISRADAAGRHVSNEADVMALLEPHGFESILPGTMPYDAQLATFRQASHIIAPHGAALAHMIVCPPGAQVLEMFHPLYSTAAFAMQAAESRVHYAAMLARDFQFDTPDWNDPERTDPSHSKFLSRHMRVDLGVLQDYLAAVL